MVKSVVSIIHNSTGPAPNGVIPVSALPRRAHSPVITVASRILIVTRGLEFPVTARKQTLRRISNHYKRPFFASRTHREDRSFPLGKPFRRSCLQPQPPVPILEFLIANLRLKIQITAAFSILSTFLITNFSRFFTSLQLPVSKIGFSRSSLRRICAKCGRDT
jgi:hypothetical protein